MPTTCASVLRGTFRARSCYKLLDTCLCFPPFESEFLDFDGDSCPSLARLSHSLLCSPKYIDAQLFSAFFRLKLFLLSIYIDYLTLELGPSQTVNNRQDISRFSSQL